MSFKIVQNDIVKVKADAIVNTANPYPVIGDGEDSDIYEAAGETELLRERVKIGNIARGDAKATPAFKLQAKVIIHTVGPVWIDGKSSELETLKSCYIRSMELAASLKCKSIAFPLISAGHYGFPKDVALSTALECFNGFLLKYPDMEITLVVYDPAAVEMSSRIFGDLESFIDEKYIDEKKERALGRTTVSNDPRMMERYRREKERASAIERAAASKKDPGVARTAGMDTWGYPEKEAALDEAGQYTFQEYLLHLIDRKELTDPEFYHSAGLSRQVFSKIRSNKDYQPSKETAVACALALKLSFDEAKALLETAGYAFSRTQMFDVVIVYCIEHGEFDLLDVNMALFKKGLKELKIS